ncbi:MAG: hypothetical protein HQL51_01645 [Magnetococcales bacterium]|nr:hypothetical protein [Magnetococcales bacterium]
MKSLGGVLLPEGLEWKDRRAWSPVVQEVTRTLSGKQVIFCGALVGGRPITLEAEDGVAWISALTVEALEALAAVPGAVYVLGWEGESFNVMFRHHEPPAVDFSPIWPHHDLHVGTLKLMTVGA